MTRGSHGWKDQYIRAHPRDPRSKFCTNRRPRCARDAGQASMIRPMTQRPKPATDARPRAITWRSVLLGILGTVFICGLTPYNDYALNNTFLVGNNLPLGVVMLAFVFIMVVNGPLSRWYPRYALSSGELTVALAMTLVSCGLPSSGLMRFFPPSLVTPFYYAQSNPEYLSLLERLDLPRLIFPSFEGD